MSVMSLTRLEMKLSRTTSDFVPLSRPLKMSLLKRYNLFQNFSCGNVSFITNQHQRLWLHDEYADDVRILRSNRRNSCN